ncbi:MAG TPA: cyclic nucleotide-binding domain-containing protein [Rhizomicrobium sp.]|nr:cyclic nucleotide-binding domain-containing protein [Rhizomicrobium sp.]
MVAVGDIFAVALLGLLATCSNLAGAALGLYFRISKLVLSGILAFAAGALINALAIDFAYKGAETLHGRGADERTTLLILGGGFAIGALFYYVAARFLEEKGAAVRYPTRFREYARERKREHVKETIELLSGCDLLRHLPAEDIEQILPCVRSRHLAPGEMLFRKGDDGDALYIIAKGGIDILGGEDDERILATLDPGKAFGEMALLGDGHRTASARASGDTELLYIEKHDFHDLIASDRQMATAVEQLSHERAVQNLAAGGPSAETWARVANVNLDHLTKRESDEILAEAADGAGLAIVFGNILDTIPGCLVIGAQFISFQVLPGTLLVGMFLGGLPEAAASANMLRKAGYSSGTILLLWSTVLFAGIVAAIAGKLLLGDSESPMAIFFQAVAGGAVLAQVAHAMIPEAIEEAGSLIVLPTVGGFLFAFYLSVGGLFS